jgi:hypothetical protein
MKDNIRRGIGNIWRRNLLSVSGNISRRCEAFLDHGSCGLEPVLYKRISLTSGANGIQVPDGCSVSVQWGFRDDCAFGTRLVVHHAPLFGHDIFTRDILCTKQDCLECGGSRRLKNGGAYVTVYTTSNTRKNKSIFWYIFITFPDASDDRYLWREVLYLLNYPWCLIVDIICPCWN